MKKLTTEEFIEKSNIAYNNKYKYERTVYTGNKNKVIFTCLIHGDIQQLAQDHMRGFGCHMCANEKRAKTQSLTKEIFIERSKNIHKDKYDYSKVIYSSYKSRVKIICPIHGEFEQLASNHIKGFGCPICNISKGELEIREYLIQNNIQFEEQKIFENCKNPLTNNNLRFDFYLLNYNLLIEFDGAQHFQSVDYWGGENGFIIQKQKDQIKNQFAKDNNIKLLRIPYFKLKNIKKILKENIV